MGLVQINSTSLYCPRNVQYVFDTFQPLTTLTYGSKGIFIDATQKLLCSEEVDIDVKVNYESGHCSWKCMYYLLICQ